VAANSLLVDGGLLQREVLQAQRYRGPEERANKSKQGGVNRESHERSPLTIQEYEGEKRVCHGCAREEKVSTLAKGSRFREGQVWSRLAWTMRRAT
jgi:hypothetical protein